MLQKEIKDWDFEVYLLTREPSRFLIPADWIMIAADWRTTCTRFYVWSLNFLVNIEGLDYFLWPNSLPKLGKIIVTCPNLENKN